MVGVGNDLQNGAFITLNGKQWKESFDDLVQAAQKANSIDITKGETLLAWATGNFDTDYNEVTLILTCWQNLSSICRGRLDNADDASEIMQRLPVGSRFAVSFCCFNKNENLYGGKEMLYTKV